MKYHSTEGRALANEIRLQAAFGERRSQQTSDRDSLTINLHQDPSRQRHVGWHVWVALPTMTVLDLTKSSLCDESCHLYPCGLNSRVKIFGQIQEIDAFCAFLACFHPDQRDCYFAPLIFCTSLVGFRC